MPTWLCTKLVLRRCRNHHNSKQLLQLTQILKGQKTKTLD